MKQKKAFTLIEILFALSVFSLVFITIFALILKSLSSVKQMENKNKATTYLQKTIEDLRIARDTSTNWSDFIDPSVCELVQSPPAPAEAGFEAYVTVFPVSESDCQNIAGFDVYICWDDCQKSVSSTSYLSNNK